MPVHGGKRWLAQTLDSVGQQDCSAVELIILDSSEDDACETIVGRYRARLNIIYERSNVLSWTAKTNAAVERARGQYVTILHQDDLWLHNRVKLVAEAVQTFPEAALIVNPSYFVNEDGARVGLWRCPLPQEQYLAGCTVAERLLVQNFISMPAPVIKKQAWLDCGGMDSDLWYTG